MTIRTMSLDQLRDWHAKREGFYFSIDRDMGPIGWCDKDGKLIGDDPFPPTLDGAASAMPEGCEWTKDFERCFDCVAWRVVKTGKYSAWLKDTGNEIDDRYRLAALARECEGKGTQ